MKKLLIGILSIVSLVLNSQTYEKTNIFIEGPMKLGTSANSVFSDTAKANTDGFIVWGVDGIDYIMDGGTPESDTTKWYVSTSGNDAVLNPHRTDSALATITEVLTRDVEAGDEVLFKRGDTWYTIEDIGGDGRVDIVWAGAEGNHITFGAYGSGALPRILGSRSLTSWTNHSGDIWFSVNTDLIAFTTTARTFFEEQDGSDSWGILETSIANLNVNYEFYQSANTDTIYIVYPTDPNSTLTSVQAPQVDGLLWITTASGCMYINIEYLELAYAWGAGIRNDYPGRYDYTLGTIQYNHIHHFGYKNDAVSFGLAISMSNMLIQYNTIHNIGRRGITMPIYAAYASRDNIIQNNILYDNWHSMMDIFGLASGGSIRNLTIRNNIMWKDTTEADYSIHFIYIDDQTGSPGGGDCPVDSVFIYNNIALNTNQGAVVVDEASNVFVDNNTFYRNNPNNYDRQINMTVRSSDVRLRNNIVYGSSRTGDTYFEIIRFDNSAPPDSVDYNLYYQTDQTVNWLYVVNGSPGDYRLDTEWSDYKTDWSPFDANSPTPADPDLIEGGYMDEGGTTSPEWSPNAGSPALGAGVPIPWITTDFYGNARDGSTPDIGAVERQ